MEPHYNLKFLILNTTKIKHNTLDSLMGNKIVDNMIAIGQIQMYINDFLINNVIISLKDIDILSGIVIPFINDSAIIMIYYDPDDTVLFENWLIKYADKIPTSTNVYLVSIKENYFNADIREKYASYKHVSINYNNKDDIEKLFMQSAKFFVNRVPEYKKTLGWKKNQVKKRRYCILW